MQIIRGKPREGATLLIYMILPLLLATPWALPNTEIAWYFSWACAAVFALWGICIQTRTSVYEPSRKLFIRELCPFGLMRATYPLSEFNALKHNIRNDEGSYFPEIIIVNKSERQSFLFACGAAFESEEKAKADPEILTLLNQLASSTALPIK